MSNGRIILWTIIISLSLIIGLSAYKISTERHEITYKVLNKKIIESASKCYYEDKCQEEMTLGELISKGYISSLVDPDTKMYYSNESTIKKTDNTFTFTPYY